MTNYDILDITKFILSIMIVAIHTSLLPTVLYPWLLLAVPLFFMISSFLLFSKVKNSVDKDKDEIIKKFIIRQIKLYLFWFIVLIPFTIYSRRSWFDMGFYRGLHTTIKNMLFSSTFMASWFITATIMSTFIVYKLSKKFNYKILLPIFMLIYFICCIVSNYDVLFANISSVNILCKIYSFFLPSPLFSFPVALLWIFIGKMFADGTIKYNIKNKKIHLLFIFILCILLFTEWKFSAYITGFYGNNCYLFLLPLNIQIFRLLLNIKITLKNAKLFRQVSTITYPLHASIAPIFSHIGKMFIKSSTLIGIFDFITTLICCYIICYIILKLENKKYFKLLKYSH